MSKITSLLLLIFAGSLILTSCKKNETYEIQYRLSGNSAHGYLVTYFNEYNSAVQDTAVLSGWTYKFTAEENYFAYVSALTSVDTSVVSVSIFVNGNLFQADSITGFKVSATAQGYIP